MSATNTALQVIEWAISQEAGGAPPQGELSGIEKLARPDATLVQALKQLTTVTAARLRWEMPPLGDNCPIGVENLIMAAALGTTNPQSARTLLQAVPASSCAGDWVVRYGLVTPALAFLGEEITDDCRERSTIRTIINRDRRRTTRLSPVSSPWLGSDWRSKNKPIRSPIFSSSISAIRFGTKTTRHPPYPCI